MRLKTRVEEFEIYKNKIKKIKINSEVINVQDSDVIISCLPTVVLGKILKSNIDCKYRGVIIISAIHSIEKLPNDYAWLYFDSEEIIFTRVTNFAKLSPNASKNLNIFMYEIPFDSDQIINERYFE